MVVYADILLFLNAVIDYLLLGITAAVMRCDIKLWRQVAAAFFGGLSAMYIFLDDSSFLLDLTVRSVMGFLTVLIAFGYKRRSYFLKAVLIFLFATFTLSGAVALLYSGFKIKGIVLNNTYFYVNTSPILLIVVTVIVYLVLKLFIRLRKTSDLVQSCQLSVFFEDRQISVPALVDSGNMLTDYLTDSEIFIVDSRAFCALTGYRTVGEACGQEGFQKRYRMIPVSTVNGSSVMEAIRCDRAQIAAGGKIYNYTKPVIAVWANPMNDAFEAIVSAAALRKEPAIE